MTGVEIPLVADHRLDPDIAHLKRTVPSSSEDSSYEYNDQGGQPPASPCSHLSGGQPPASPCSHLSGGQPPAPPCSHLSEGQPPASPCSYLSSPDGDEVQGMNPLVSVYIPSCEGESGYKAVTTG